MGIGAGMCCPPAVEPPTPQLLKCKRILQGLAVGLLPLMGLCLATQYVFQFFIFLFLVFFLFMGWRSLNWCSVLFFFLYALMQLVQASILLAGYIQYDKLFAHRYIVESVFIIIEILYFAVAIFFSHFVYKHFKNLSNGGGMFFNNNEAQLQEQGQGQGNYQAVREQPRPNAAARAFQGQGVRIG